MFEKLKVTVTHLAVYFLISRCTTNKLILSLHHLVLFHFSSEKKKHPEKNKHPLRYVVIAPRHYISIKSPIPRHPKSQPMPKLEYMAPMNPNRNWVQESRTPPPPTPKSPTKIPKGGQRPSFSSASLVVKCCFT